MLLEHVFNRSQIWLKFSFSFDAPILNDCTARAAPSLFRRPGWNLTLVGVFFLTPTAVMAVLHSAISSGSSVVEAQKE